MNREHIETLIIGAGPAGMAAAIELARAGKKFIIIEKDSKVGGLSKTYEYKEGDCTFYTDNGPHRFFSKNKKLYEFIEGVLGNDWIEVNRQTRQFIDGKFYDYPVNFGQALKNIGLLRASKMGFDYFIAKIQYGLFKKPINNFRDYVIANFGKSLGEFNMINYTEKIWGIPSSDIHSDWAGQRIKGLSIRSLVLAALKKKFGMGKTDAKSLVDVFYYPRKGTGQIYEAIAAELKNKGYEILCNAQPTSVKHDGKRITEVIVDVNGSQRIFAFDHLVESVPLPQFVTMLDPKVSATVEEANKKLRYRSQAYVFLTLDKDSITKDQWIYFPKKENKIGRVSEMKNFSTYMSPAGKTSLFVEYFCFEGDETWNMNDDDLIKHTIKEMSEIGFFKTEEVRKGYVMRKKNVYPIYDVHYKSYLNVVKDFLNHFENLYFIGRPGRFRYNNQDHSLEMGFLAARSIIEGVKHDIEAVGSENEYYESGKIQNTKHSA